MLKRALQICKELSPFVHIKRLTSPTRAFAVHRLQIQSFSAVPKEPLMFCMENFQIILNKASKYAHTFSFQPPKKNIRCLHISSCQRVPKDQSVSATTPLHTSLKRVLTEVTVCTWHIHNFQ